MYIGHLLDNTLKEVVSCSLFVQLWTLDLDASSPPIHFWMDRKKLLSRIPVRWWGPDQDKQRKPYFPAEQWPEKQWNYIVLSIFLILNRLSSSLEDENSITMRKILSQIKNLLTEKQLMQIADVGNQLNWRVFKKKHQLLRGQIRGLFKANMVSLCHYPSPAVIQI